MSIFTTEHTSRIELSYDQTVSLMVQFLEKELTSYSEGLLHHCREYTEGQAGYQLEDVKDNVKILDAIQHVLSYYKEP